MSDTPGSPLDLLMSRLAEGDRSAFPAVFAELLPKVERLCRSLMHHDADTADAVQEAMKKIFERAADYESGRPALPWALAIAGWECRTLLRKRGRRREVPEAELELRAEVRPSVEDSFVQRELGAAALTALGELSELDRATLFATFWEESDEAAGATLRKRRERAIARLRAVFRRIYGLG